MTPREFLDAELAIPPDVYPVDLLAAMLSAVWKRPAERPATREEAYEFIEKYNARVSTKKPRSR